MTTIYSVAKLKEQINGGKLPSRKFSKQEIDNLRDVHILKFMTWWDNGSIAWQQGQACLSKNKSVRFNGSIAIDLTKPKEFTKTFKNPCRPIDFLIQYYDMNFYQACFVLSAYLEQMQNQDDFDEQLPL